MNTLSKFAFKKRLLSFRSPRSDRFGQILSVSEVSELFHFPYKNLIQTENMAKVISRELPAPLSLKRGEKLSVIFGKNTYGGTETLIGQTEEVRSTHTYILGRTGGGKTNLMMTMMGCDLVNNQGLAYIDPHGDAAENLIYLIPEDRRNDFIYFNPVDLKHPIGINILELTQGQDEDAAEMEKERVCEGVISLFRTERLSI